MILKNPQKTINILAIAIGALFVVCTALLIALVIVSGSPASVDNPPSGPVSTQNNSVVLAKTSDAGDSYIKKIVFVGDSTTYHLKCKLGMEQIWVPEDGTWTLDVSMTKEKIVYAKDNTRKTLAEAAALEKPEYMVITLGINGVSFLGKDDFKTFYKKVITTVQTASPSTKIMLQSIFPVTKSLNDEGKFTNKAIDAANGWVRELAAECGVKYLDTASALKDSNNAMRDSYNSYHGDGIHMYTEGYEVVLDYIKTHAYKN